MYSDVPATESQTQMFQDSVSQITAATASGSSLPESHRHQVKHKHHGHVDDEDEDVKMSWGMLHHMSVFRCWSNLGHESMYALQLH